MRILSVVAGICLLLSACTKTSIRFGEEFVDNGYTNIIMIDTFRPAVSTIIRDSFATSGSGTAIIGYFEDPVFGKINASSFLRLAAPRVEELPASATYDSIVLLGRSDGSYYGDTSAPQTVSVFRLTETIETDEDDGLVYNTTSFTTAPAALGTNTLYIRPASNDTLRIRLADEFGNELFTLYKQRSNTLTDAGLFREYFKGIRISPNAANQMQGIFGWKDSSIVVRVYYHQTGVFREEKHFDLAFTDKSRQFNRISFDRSGTPLHDRRGTFRSELAGNRAFLQPLTGLFVKVRFPSLRNLLEREDFVKLLRAELVVRPVRNSFNDFTALPSQISLATTDATNDPLGYLEDINGLLTGNLVIDDVLGENTYYEYDISAYIAELIEVSETNDYGVLLDFARTTNSNSLNRLVAGNAVQTDGNMQLKLYYVSVQ